MALSFTTLSKPANSQVVDPSTGVMSLEWQLYFGDLTTRLNGAVDELTNPAAVPPIDAEYVVAASNGTLTAERVLGSSTSIAKNVATPGAVTLERAALTGDVTAGANSNSTTIPNDTVTFAKMQNITTDRLLGRGTVSSGDVEEISLGGGLEFTGGPGIQRSALTGDVAASAGSGTTTIQPDAVTYAKLQNVSATARILGRKTAGAGDAEECTLSEVLDFIGSAAQGDLLYRGASAWARLPAGTPGQFLKTSGAGANPAWGEGGTVLLTSGTVSAAAALSIVLTSYTSYRGLLFRLSNFIPASDAIFMARLSTNGGSTYDSGATDYDWAQHRTRAGAAGSDAGSAGDTKIQITGIDLVESTSGFGLSAEVYLMNQVSTARHPSIYGQGLMSIAANVGQVCAINFAGRRGTAQDTDAIQFFFPSVNITTGLYAVYGLL